MNMNWQLFGLIIAWVVAVVSVLVITLKIGCSFSYHCSKRCHMMRVEDKINRVRREWPIGVWCVSLLVAVAWLAAAYLS